MAVILPSIHKLRREVGYVPDKSKVKQFTQRELKTDEEIRRLMLKEGKAEEMLAVANERTEQLIVAKERVDALIENLRGTGKKLPRELIEQRKYLTNELARDVAAQRIAAKKLYKTLQMSEAVIGASNRITLNEENFDRWHRAATHRWENPDNWRREWLRKNT